MADIQETIGALQEIDDAWSKMADSPYRTLVEEIEAEVEEANTAAVAALQKLEELESQTGC